MLDIFIVMKLLKVCCDTWQVGVWQISISLHREKKILLKGHFVKKKDNNFKLSCNLYETLNVGILVQYIFSTLWSYFEKYIVSMYSKKTVKLKTCQNKCTSANVYFVNRSIWTFENEAR